MFEDALEYPFLSAMLAPFGPEAVLPFEPHLRQLHSECGQEQGGCWFKMSGASKSSRAIDGVTAAGGSDGTATGEASKSPLQAKKFVVTFGAEQQLGSCRVRNRIQEL